LQTQLATQLTQLQAQETALAQVSAQQQLTQASLDTLTAQVTALTAQVLQNQADNAAQIAALQASLNSSFSTLQSLINGLSADLQAEIANRAISEGLLNGQITTLQGQVTTLNGQVTGLNGSLTTLQGQVTQLTTDVANLQTLAATVTALNGTVVAQGTSITTLIDRVGKLEKRDQADALASFNVTNVGGTFTDLTNATLTINAPTAGRLLVMYQGATSNAGGSGNPTRSNSARITLDGTPDGTVTVSLPAANTDVAIGKMAIFNVTAGSHTVTLQGMASPNNTNAAFRGEIVALLLDSTDTPLSNP
jgi:phage shock protein A